VGHISSFRMSPEDDFQLGLDILSEDFRTALSNAIGRATNRMKALPQTPEAAQKARAVAAGSSADSA
jgi:hypothetical protein